MYINGEKYAPWSYLLRKLSSIKRSRSDVQILCTWSRKTQPRKTLAVTLGWCHSSWLLTTTNTYLGGGFKYFFIFTPTWGNDPIWRAYFSKGLKPPTRGEVSDSYYTNTYNNKKQQPKNPTNHNSKKPIPYRCFSLAKKNLRRESEWT